MAKRGREPKLTPELQEQLTQGVALGLPYRVACERIGLALTTFYRWKRRGKEQSGNNAPYVAFLAALARARASDQARRIKRIEEVARGGKLLYEKRMTTIKPNGDKVEVVEQRFTPPNWRPDAWHLERTDPENWGGIRHVLAEVRKEMDRLKKMVGPRPAPRGV